MEDLFLEGGSLVLFPLDLVIGGQVVPHMYDKGGAFSRFAAVVDGASQQIHQIAADVETQACAFTQAAAGLFLLLEGQEHALLEFGADADAVVHNGISMIHLFVRIADIDLQGDFSALRGEFQGIGQQVHQNPFHMLQVHHDITVFT